MNVLCITPFFGRTGSEINLLNLINSQSSNVNFTVYSSFSKGSLEKDLKSNANYFYYSGSIFNRIINKILELFSYSIYEMHLNKILKKYNIDVIYVNTIINSQVIPFLRKTKVPFVIHIHELESFYEIVSKENFKFLINESRSVIVCSEKLRSNFSNMTMNPVHYLPGTFNFKQIVKSNEEKQLESLRFTWICSGQKSYRKGFDLLPEVARMLPEDDFIWLGGSANTGLEYAVEQYIKKYNLKNCRVIGEQKEEYYSYFKKADGFLLLSREDPYPLVMIEAANFKLPIVGFKSGGFVEFSEKFVNSRYVEIGDIDNLVLKMKEIKGSKNLDFSKYQDLIKIHDSNIVSNDFVNILESVLIK